MQQGTFETEEERQDLLRDDEGRISRIIGYRHINFRRRVIVAVAVVLVVLIVVVIMLTAPSRDDKEDDGGGGDDGNNHVVIMVSMDGFRHDYVDMYPDKAFNILKFRSNGTYVKSMKNAFVTKTFPNHYALATGLFHESHGIVGNNFRDPSLNMSFSMSSHHANDTRWWLGEPIWVTAEKQGQKAASMFWVGSDFIIHGRRPTYWFPYNGSVRFNDRVDQVLEWLSLPLHSRPKIITLYFEEPDSTGHRYGPNSSEVRDIIGTMDKVFNRLLDGIAQRKMEDQVNLILTADHGMAELSKSRVIYLEDYIDPTLFTMDETSPMAAIWPNNPDNTTAIYNALVNATPLMSVHLKQDMPDRFHYSHSIRIAPIIALAAEGWSITRWHTDDCCCCGNHGYDNELPSMQPIFMARGPAFRQGGFMAPQIMNVDVYGMICKIMGIHPSPNNGSIERILPLLRP